jgi:lysophospholipase L1-like esterase
MPEVKESHLVFYRLCFSCCFTLFLIVLVEVGSAFVLRVKGYPRSNLPQMNESSVYASEPWGKEYWKEHHEASKFSYEPYVVWKQLPYSGQTVTVESDMHRRTLNSQCDDKAYTIWMLGGSTTWGTGSPDWGTIPSQIAELFSRAGSPVCVRNLAQTGWDNTQEVIELLLELKRNPHHPNLVVFYDGYNDGYSFYQSGKIDAHLNYDLIREQMERPSRERRLGWVTDFLLSTHTARLITGAPSPSTLIEGFGVHPPPPPNEAESRKDLDIAYLENLDVVQGLSKDYDFQYVFFWQPVIFAGHKPLTEEESKIRRAYSAGIYETDFQYQDMAKVFRAGGRPHLFDISDVFDDCKQTIYVDYVHVSPEGNRLVAKRMYDILQQAATLPHSDATPAISGRRAPEKPTIASHISAAGTFVN